MAYGWYKVNNLKLVACARFNNKDDNVAGDSYRKYAHNVVQFYDLLKRASIC